MRSALALAAALACCRRAPSPPASPARAPVDAARALHEALLDAGAPAPPSDAGPGDTGVVTDVLSLSAWSEAAPGVRWRRATVRFEAASPSEEFPGVVSSTLSWVVARVEVARVAWSVERAPGDSVAELWERDRSPIALVNAGFFEPSYAASGLVLANHRRLAQAGPRGGSGALVIADGVADVLCVDARDAGGWEPDAGGGVAVQCGPRLVERGGAPGIFRDDRRFFARTAACVRDRGRTLDLVATWDVHDPLRGPGLYYFARMLAGPSPVGDDTGCELALNLDGGPSTALYVRGPRERTRGGYRKAPIGPTPWALVVRPL